MNQQEEKNLMSAIYDRLFQAVTYSPNIGKTPFEKDSTFIQFAKNLAINPLDFKDQISPVNPNGDMRATENFSRFVDVLPSVDSQWTPTSGRVSETYGQIVNGANSLLQPSEEQKKLYDLATNFLTQTITVTDFTGAKSTQIVDSQIYHTYKNNQIAYVAALAAYQNAKNKYNLDILSDQRAWLANEPMLQLAVTTAYNNWQAQGATQVQQALNAQQSTINNIVSSVIAGAKSSYNTTGLPSLTPGSTNWHIATPYPTNWISPTMNGFSGLELSSTKITETSSSTYTKYSSGLSASWGLWSVGGGVSGSHAESHYSMQADSVDISCNIAIVSIDRPWMNDLIFKLNGWSELGQAANSISTGNLETMTKSQMLPLIPTGFIVAKDIRISAGFTTEDKSHVENAISTNASVGWGPFAISGSYASGSSSDYFNSTFNGGTLVVPGYQIIAWINQVVPASAPLAG